MDVENAIQGRRSIRKYSSKKIDKVVLNKLIDSIVLAPSAKNLQPYKFIIVDDSAVKERLVPVCRNQKFLSEAPIVICACVESKDSYSKMGGYYTSEYVDAAIAIDHFTLQAYELGLGTCWIGAFEEDGVKSILNIPEDVRVAALTPVGYPSEKGVFKGRKNKKELFYKNKFGEVFGENNI